MKKINNSANMQNANKGLSGVNKQFAQNQGNRSKQLNPMPNNAKGRVVNLKGR